MARLTRRRLLKIAGVGAAALAAGLVGLRFGLPRLLRPGRPRELSDEAASFVQSCFAGLDRGRIWDTHVHVIGVGAGETGCWINPKMQDHLSPVRRFRFDVIRSALGMADLETADADYVARLLSLHRAANPGGRLLAMAFDTFVDEQGVEHRELSSFHTPDAYVLRLAAENRDVEACASIHPYRKDAVDRLDAAAAGGARAVKWLPNSMGIDPASPHCDPFYRRMAELRLPLITHGGREYAVDLRHDQELGNPLRLRRALDAGVRVVVSHCASFGSLDDTDDAEGQRRQLEAFDLFMRLFTDPQYADVLFADISSLTLINRSARVVRELLIAQELHPRLVDGSDYPIPALNFLFSTLKLRHEGFLTPHQRRLCNEVAAKNPLLFDFVVKRTLRVEHEGREYGFSPAVFQTDWLFS